MKIFPPLVAAAAAAAVAGLGAPSAHALPNPAECNGLPANLYASGGSVT
jgi:hypothetical protein